MINLNEYWGEGGGGGGGGRGRGGGKGGVLNILTCSTIYIFQECSLDFVNLQWLARAKTIDYLHAPCA